MTPGEAFEKAAMDRFQEVKLAGLGDLFKNLGGMKGIYDKFSGGTFGADLGGAWRGLSDEQRRRALGSLALGATGAIYGYNTPDRHASTVDRLISAGMYGLGGGIGGHYAGGQYHGFVTPPTP